MAIVARIGAGGRRSGFRVGLLGNITWMGPRRSAERVTIEDETQRLEALLSAGS